MAPPHVVIVGAGFGGLTAARRLAGAPVRVTLVDRHNYHLFQPLLYQVATAGLSPGEIAYPIRAILRRQENAQVLMAEAVAVDLHARRLKLADGALGYDYLILAAGARHSYFGHPEWEGLAPGLKDVEDAVEIRCRILTAFERAERETEAARRRALLTFAIVGGGPTGVELAGAIADIARRVMVKDFRAIDPREARIVLLEGGPRILPAFSPRLSAKAAAALRHLGVEVRTGALVHALAPGLVSFRAGDAAHTVEAATVLWAAGVEPAPLARSLGVSLDHAGRVAVESDLSLAGHPECFVIGDLASLAGPEGRPYPGLAPVALQQGHTAAANLLRRSAGTSTLPFRYRDKGDLATIGRARAVAAIAGLELWGLPAWLVWIFVHILYLIGFRNRLLVVAEWTWDYLSFQQAARLITGRRSRET